MHWRGYWYVIISNAILDECYIRIGHIPGHIIADLHIFFSSEFESSFLSKMSLFCHHEHGWGLSQGLLKNIQWFHTYTSPTGYTGSLLSSNSTTSQNVWQTYCRNVNIVYYWFHILVCINVKTLGWDCPAGALESLAVLKKKKGIDKYCDK